MQTIEPIQSQHQTEPDHYQTDLGIKNIAKVIRKKVNFSNLLIYRIKLKKISKIQVQKRNLTSPIVLRKIKYLQSLKTTANLETAFYQI